MSAAIVIHCDARHGLAGTCPRFFPARTADVDEARQAAVLAGWTVRTRVGDLCPTCTGSRS